MTIAGVNVATEKDEVLILVHPGSCCGSASYNLGRHQARASRADLCSALNRWNGGVVVLDGELSDELPSYPDLDAAIKSVLARAEKAGHTCMRVDADDPDQIKESLRIARLLRWKKTGTQCKVTGAWFHEEDGGGCVGSVVEALNSLGVSAVVGEGAFEIDCAWS